MLCVLRMKLSLVLGVVCLVGCGTNAVDVGTVQVGQYTFSISREGAAPAAGVSTDYVVKPTSGGMPTSVDGWVGTADEPTASKTASVFDSNDGDFDTDLTIPSPMPTDAMFYFDVNTGGTVLTGSIALK